MFYFYSIFFHKEKSEGHDSTCAYKKWAIISGALKQWLGALMAIAAQPLQVSSPGREETIFISTIF